MDENYIRPKAYDGNEPYIFISYAHKDEDLVFPIIEKLNDSGYRVWYDDGIDPGTEWDTTIARRVINCSIMIAMISENYLKSKNCKDELNLARDKDKQCLLVYLNNAELPEGMQLRLGRLQALFKYRYKIENNFYDKLFKAEGLDECLKEEYIEEEEEDEEEIEEAPPKPVKKKTNKAPVRRKSDGLDAMLFSRIVCGACFLLPILIGMIFGFIFEAEMIKWIILGVIGLAVSFLSAVLFKNGLRFIIDFSMLICIIVALALGQNIAALALSASMLLYMISTAILTAVLPDVKEAFFGEDEDEGTFLINACIELIAFFVGAVISGGILLFPLWGIWAMVFIGGMLGLGILGITITLVVLDIDDSGEFVGLITLIPTVVAGAILIFLSRETAYVALPLLIASVGILITACLGAYAGYHWNSASYIGFFGGFAILVLLTLSILWINYWKPEPFTIDLPKEAVTYNLNRDDGEMFLECPDGVSVLAKVRAPNALVIALEDGFERIQASSLEDCEDMKTLYLPSTVTEIESYACSSDSLTRLYIGYNYDNTPNSQRSMLTKISISAFSNSSLRYIYYNGTMAEWEAIEKEVSEGWFGTSTWDSGMGYYEITCLDGVIKK